MGGLEVRGEGEARLTHDIVALPICLLIPLNAAPISIQFDGK